MMLSVIVTKLWLSAVVEIEDTVGAVASTTNVFTLNAVLAFPAESVTVMVQFE